MPFEDATAGDHHVGSVVSHRSEGSCRLVDEHIDVGPARSGDVAEMLERMHATNVRAPCWLSHLGLGSLRSHAVAPKLPSDLHLTPLGAKSRELSEWLTTFHLASVVLDPYTNESSWVLKTAVRILEELRGADVRVNFIVTAGEDDTRAFLGPLTERFLVFCDPDRKVVSAMGLRRLPAFVFTRVDLEGVSAAEGWNPAEWRGVAEAISGATGWRPPDIPEPADPRPFAGAPALG
jgi:hypothetical protein